MATTPTATNFTPTMPSGVKVDFNASIFPGMRGYQQPTPKVEDYIVIYPKTEIDTLNAEIAKAIEDSKPLTALTATLQADWNTVNAYNIRANQYCGSGHVASNTLCCDRSKMPDKPDQGCRDNYRNAKYAIEGKIASNNISLALLQKIIDTNTAKIEQLKNQFNTDKEKAITNFNLAVQTWSTNAAEWYKLEADRIAKEKKEADERASTLASSKAASDAKIEADKAKQKADLEKEKLAALTEAAKAGVSEDSALKAIGNYVGKDNTNVFVGGGLIALVIIALIVIFN